MPTGWMMLNYELKRIWKEAALSWNLHGRTEENHETPVRIAGAKIRKQAPREYNFRVLPLCKHATSKHIHL
jgi:hypothetical protein